VGANVEDGGNVIVGKNVGGKVIRGLVVVGALVGGSGPGSGPGSGMGGGGGPRHQFPSAKFSMGQRQRLGSQGQQSTSGARLLLPSGQLTQGQQFSPPKLPAGQN